MSQHDYDLANASGAAFRADLNNALAAIVTWNSGASDPSTTFGRMRAVNTTTGVVKRRNAANSGWIVESTDDESRVVSRSSNTMLDVSDITKKFRVTAGFTQTFDAAATLGDGWWVGYRIESGVTITFDPNGSENIDGATTKVVVGPASGFIACDGSALYTFGFMAANPPSQQIFTASGTWTRPAGVTRVIVEVVGGGGGGGGASSGSVSWFAASGGGSGAYSRKLIDVSSIASATITIGASGPGGAAGSNDGTAGGNSSWADGTNTVTSNGGSPGLGSAADFRSGGAGGTATGGDVNIVGNSGGGSIVNTNAWRFSGFGGASYFGGSPAGSYQGTAGAVAGTAGDRGAGGSGAQTGASAASDRAGGNGGAGLIIVTEFK